MKATLLKKGGMTTIFSQDGNALPATKLVGGNCSVCGLKTKEKDGYEAVLLALKGKKTVKREIKEWSGEVSLDQEIKVGEIFKEGDLVNVTGTSKGKGFAGVVKRWHFRGGPRTHGQSDRERAPGSIGSTTTPGRVYKGKKMAGKMGQRKTTTKNLKVIKVDMEKNEIYLQGAVPGVRGGLLLVKKNE